MNQTNPNINKAVVDQGMETRRTAAENYRIARSAKGAVRPGRVNSWRDALGHRLVSLGERVATHKPTGLPNV